MIRADEPRVADIATAAAPPISVAILTYNYARYIGGCIDSVVNQTVPAAEIIVIDDASSDETHEIIESLDQPGLRYIRHPKNMGPARARNTAIEEATNDVVAFLDADDLMAVDNLEIKAEIHRRRSDAGLVFSNARIIDESGRVLGVGNRDAISRFIDGDELFRMLLKSNPFFTSSVSLSKSVVQELGGFDEDLRHGEDWDLWLRIASVAGAVYESRPLVHHRIHTQSLQKLNFREHVDLQAMKRIFQRAERRGDLDRAGVTFEDVYWTNYFRMLHNQVGVVRGREIMRLYLHGLRSHPHRLIKRPDLALVAKTSAFSMLPEPLLRRLRAARLRGKYGGGHGDPPRKSSAWSIASGKAPLGARLRGKLVRYRGWSNALRIAAHPSGHVGYVGWTGYRNMGDEAIFEALTRSFPEARLSPLPTGSPSRYTPKWNRRLRAALLGGGTLIGIRAFRQPLEAMLESSPADPVLAAIGTGVEDPGFHGSAAPAVETELREWTPLLRRFSALTVRGPRSQETLRRLGIEAPVVGDPALLFRGARPAPYKERLLGINLGVASAMWGNDPDGLLDDVTAFGRRMGAEGWRIRLVGIWPRDMAYIEEAARRIGGDVEVAKGFPHLDDLLRLLEECHVFVGQKLHSVVLASSRYVPSVSLEYQPKCLDFQLSLDRERFNVRVDEVVPEAMVELVEELAESRELHEQALFRAVADRVEAIESQVRLVSAALTAARA